MEAVYLKIRLAVVEHHFLKACQQIHHLNYRLSNLERRYNKAKKEENRPFRYSLRLRIAVVDGLRDVYHEFAFRKAKESEYLKSAMVKLSC